MSTISAEAHPSRAWHYGLWVVQILLALAFGMAGTMKTFSNLDTLGQSMAWVHYSPAALVRFVGVSELAGALGMILPSALRIQPILTPIAAIGFVTIMVLALGMHGTHGELAMAAPVNLTLGALAAFVAWGRLVKAPISAR